MADGYLIQVTGCLLSVTGDERDGGPLRMEFGYIVYAPLRKAQFLGNFMKVFAIHDKLVVAG
jgi:hypothetical protein